MLEDALAGLESEVEAQELGVLVFQLVHHPQRLGVVLEAAVGLHAGVQCVLPGMAERGVAEVVGQADRLGEILVDAQGAGDGTGDLTDFQRMSQPGAEQIALVIDEDLGLVFQAPERGAVDDAVAVTLVLAAAGRRRLRVASAARVLRGRGVGREAVTHAGRQ